MIRGRSRILDKGRATRSIRSRTINLPEMLVLRASKAIFSDGNHAVRKLLLPEVSPELQWKRPLVTAMGDVPGVSWHMMTFSPSHRLSLSQDASFSYQKRCSKPQKGLGILTLLMNSNALPWPDPVWASGWTVWRLDPVWTSSILGETGVGKWIRSLIHPPSVVCG